VVCLAAVICC